MQIVEEINSTPEDGQEMRHTPTDVKERPIIFTPESIRKILSGDKTQTRRLIKPQPVDEDSPWPDDDSCLTITDLWKRPNHYAACGYCPYGKLGDRLWSREPWLHLSPESLANFDTLPQRDLFKNQIRWNPDGNHEDGDSFALYRADVQPSDLVFNKGYDWKWAATSPIFMPRWASRLTLVIEDIGVEQLEEISEEDAKAEGAEQSTCDHPDCVDHVYGYRAGYCLAWNKINGKKYPWGSKLWVWVITFARD